MREYMKQVNRLIAISIYVENGVVGGSVRYELSVNSLTLALGNVTSCVDGT